MLPGHIARIADAKLKNVLFYPYSVNKFYGREGFTKGLFVGRDGLTGMFALSYAIARDSYKEIYLCFSEDTEVFTSEGWKYFKDLIGDELILTRKYNGITGWSKINKKIEYDYKGYLNHIKSKGIDLLVTDEHKFGLVSNDKKEYTWKNVKNFNKNIKYFIPRTFIWKGKEKKYFFLPEVLRLKKNKYWKTISKIEMTNWVKFLGLYLTEGCCSINGGNYKVTIYQNHTEKKDKYIKNILDNLPIKYHKHKRGWVFYNKQIVFYLKRFGRSYEKYIPKEILSLKKKYLSILLESMIFGDGSVDKKGNLWYYSCSKQLIDDVQEIAFKCGYCGEIYDTNKLFKKTHICTTKRRSWTVYIHKSKKQGNINRISVGNLLVKNHIKKTTYSGKLYDINVDNHTLWVRRNNICCWSGNCGYDFGHNNKTARLTHWYQDMPKAKELIGHNGLGMSYIYNHKVDGIAAPNPKQGINDFDVYKGLEEKIYTVGFSRIKSFDNISYERMFEIL
jgi:hypothetical protein